MPPDTVYVGRPTMWGMPREMTTGVDKAEAVARYRAYLLAEGRPLLERIGELAGKNLACWCPLDQPCHADVLLELANAPRGGATRAKPGAGQKGGAKR